MFTNMLSFMGSDIGYVIMILFGLFFWLALIIPPIIYIVYSIRQRRQIIKQLERLNQEVCSLRQKFETDQQQA